MKGREARPHIGIFGRRNNGKSSLINVLGGQDIAIVSKIPGTTTDPVKKSIEIPGIGPAVMIDTAGMDDSGELGDMRTKKSLDTIKIIDLALLIIAGNTFGVEEEKIIENFKKWEVSFIIIHNKSDLAPITDQLFSILEKKYHVSVLNFSTLFPENIELLISTIRKEIPESAYLAKTLIGDIISQGDLVLLITPIDDEAPEGRLILPQVQAIRDILDNDAIAVVAKEREVDALLKVLKPRPALAITDSQVFLKADASVPDDIPLTSFSTVLARYKGDFDNYLLGTPHLSELKSGDKVLILESCTHHVSCDDIGRIKIPRWLSNFTGQDLSYQVVSGLDKVPGKITDYSMVIQCGGCMITRKQLINRLKPAIDAGIPVSNYGMSIAYMQGIYNRAIAPFVKSDNHNTNYL
ncbi:MAG: [FeFe] hydrogenase H-cluster maturation GTPase HydF [Bacteroidales bacterium]|nr:[FeFe] hydrogenase H-cluster maturation GTPase HydF [Bacteroidales bacterium]MCF8405874.1 [FeFe] hydrogenase H-cluster maturation GTPase HydF [Bacteroidales bacterium]